jgi:molybdopterin-synthase adenylyltransferase
MSSDTNSGQFPVTPGIEGSRLRAYPVRIVDHGADTVVKRGVVEIKILGTGSATIVRRLFDLLSREGLHRDELIARFPEMLRPDLSALLDELIARRFVHGSHEAQAPDAAIESGRGVFYWHFGTCESQIRDALTKRKIAIVGLNVISTQIAARLDTEAGLTLTLVDEPFLRGNPKSTADQASAIGFAVHPATSSKQIVSESEISELDENYDCVIATCESDGQHSLRRWNKYCIHRKIPFLPIFVVDLIGYVGPFVIPGQTACFECLRFRQDSNMSDPALARLFESAASDSGRLACHPSITTILSEIAAIELIRFFGIGWPWWRVGTLIEMNVITMSTKTRKVLKLPRCPICGSINLQAPTR